MEITECAFKTTAWKSPDFVSKSSDSIRWTRIRPENSPWGLWAGRNWRVYLPYHHVFIPSIVKGVDIFRVKEERRGAIYVGEGFLQRWKQAKLKGLDFRLAWDSDLPPDQQPNYWESKPVKL